MYCIFYWVKFAYFTELNLQICNYAQKRHICHENCKYALDESFATLVATEEKMRIMDLFWWIKIVSGAMFTDWRWSVTFWKYYHFVGAGGVNYLYGTIITFGWPLKSLSYTHNKSSHGQTPTPLPRLGNASIFTPFVTLPYYRTIIETCCAEKYMLWNIVSTLVHYPHHQGNNLVLVGSHWMTLKVCLSGASHRGDQEATVSRQDPQLEHPFTHILHFDITSSQPSACQKIH